MSHQVVHGLGVSPTSLLLRGLNVGFDAATLISGGNAGVLARPDLFALVPDFYIGLSSDMKPVSFKRGAMIYETDTGYWYRFDGFSWNKYLRPKSV